MEGEDTKLDRLVSVSESMHVIGVKSPTSFYKIVANKELPPLIKRGTRSFLRESDLRAYVSRLASSRGAA